MGAGDPMPPLVMLLAFISAVTVMSSVETEGELNKYQSVHLVFVASSGDSKYGDDLLWGERNFFFFFFFM